MDWSYVFTRLVGAFVGLSLLFAATFWLTITVLNLIFPAMPSLPVAAYFVVGIAISFFTLFVEQ